MSQSSLHDRLFKSQPLLLVILAPQLVLALVYLLTRPGVGEWLAPGLSAIEGQLLSLVRAGMGWLYLSIALFSLSAHYYGLHLLGRARPFALDGFSHVAASQVAPIVGAVRATCDTHFKTLGVVGVGALITLLGASAAEGPHALVATPGCGALFVAIVLIAAILIWMLDTRDSFEEWMGSVLGEWPNTAAFLETLRQNEQDGRIDHPGAAARVEAQRTFMKTHRSADWAVYEQRGAGIR